MYFLKFELNSKEKCNKNCELIKTNKFWSEREAKSYFTKNYKINFNVVNHSKNIKITSLNSDLINQLNCFLDFFLEISSEVKVLWSCCFLRWESYKNNELLFPRALLISYFSQQYKYFLISSLNNLILKITHFFSSKNSKDFTYYTLQKSIHNSINDFEYQSIVFKELKSHFKKNDFSKKITALREYRNKCLAHIINPFLIQKFHTFSKNINSLHCYKQNLLPNINIVFEIADFIKKIYFFIVPALDVNMRNRLFFSPNVFALENPHNENVIYDQEKEANFSYFFPKEWDFKKILTNFI